MVQRQKPTAGHLTHLVPTYAPLRSLLDCSCSLTLVPQQEQVAGLVSCNGLLHVDDVYLLQELQVAEFACSVSAETC
jgi:hypothetical protein